MKAVRFAGLLLFIAFGFTAISSAQTITCSSDDMHYHTCSIGSNSDVRLVRQRSDAQCVRGQTWGTRGNQIWVDRGCRADFEIVARGNGRYDNNRHNDRRDDRHDNRPGYGYNQGGGGGTTNIYCASDNGKRNFCNVGSNRGIRLVRQRSDSRCDMGRTYGFSRDQIWVDRGCRADFEVRR